MSVEGSDQMVPAAVTLAVLAQELPAAHRWAARHTWTLEADLNALRLTATTHHPGDHAELVLIGQCAGYRAVPPAWQFVDPRTGQPTPQAFPAPGPAAGGSSIFHTTPVLCAPWNRLAYAENGGPHGDWATAAGWLNVRNTTQATTIADMLATIDAHLRSSPGRQG
jgi:hypothetical protein